MHSKLDYCNSLYYNLPNTQLRRLQLIQNSLARAVISAPKFTHTTPVLKSLHWLNALSIKFCLSLINFLIPLSLPIYVTWYLSNPLAALAHHHSSALLNLLLAHPWKSQIAHFDTHNLTSGINFLAHFVNRVLISLFLICYSLIVISAHLHPHHFHLLSHLLFSFPAQNIPFSEIFS